MKVTGTRTTIEVTRVGTKFLEVLGAGMMLP
jgi:hypothetical protein